MYACVFLGEYSRGNGVLSPVGMSLSLSFASPGGVWVAQVLDSRTGTTRRKRLAVWTRTALQGRPWTPLDEQMSVCGLLCHVPPPPLRRSLYCTRTACAIASPRRTFFSQRAGICVFSIRAGIHLLHLLSIISFLVFQRRFREGDGHSVLFLYPRIFLPFIPMIFPSFITRTHTHTASLSTYVQIYIYIRTHTCECVS